MFKDKITYLIDLLNADSRQLAMYSDFSESVVSRLKTGARQPDKDSRTVSKLVRGAYLCSEDKGRLDALCRAVGCAEGDRDIKTVCTALTDWLFDGREVDSFAADSGSAGAEDGSLFGKKLGTLMELAELSNSRLSKAVNVDPSYISRLRVGGRQIKRSNKLPKRICDILAARLIEKDCLNELSMMMSLPAETVGEAELSEILLDWLSDKDAADDLVVVKQFIKSLEDFPAHFELPELPIDDRCVFSDSYIGAEGLRQAVTRFLCSAIRNGSGELLLYSDAGLEWLGNSFITRWTALMTACVKKNTRIRIIHNVDRNARELITAITDWLPLYMTGLIEPYYCVRKQGERFGCTIFLDPGSACVESFCVKSIESTAEYSYITEPERLEVCRRNFDALLNDSLPLMKISHAPLQMQGNCSVFNMGKIQICIGAKSVIVNKLSEPFMSFSAAHPLLCGAFRTFVEAQSGE
ncbi:MAG: hypothetical protein K6B74_07430 [Ruminococcus sp.]|nr:hypothetical protein [Ruminococcus sp.]